MSKEVNKKRVRSKARQRQIQRQKMMITGGLVAVVILIIVLCVFLLGSCSSYDDTDTNTVYILDNGKVVSTTVEPFDKDAYSEKELKSYMKDVIRTYNNENGSGSVKQKSFDIKDDVATLVMQYASADFYEAFDGTEIFVGSIAEAVEAGYAFDVQFAEVDGEKVSNCDITEIMKDDSYTVVIIKANTKVSVEGDICYISTENISDYGNDWVVIKNGGDVLELALAESLDSTEGTEAEEAITDEELLESSIVFDFGEEEVEDSQYTEVYTYIIYK